MGIRGLTTYISQNSDIFLENFQLKDTHLVIDGCSLAAQLYRSCTKANDSFGGDYDKYRKSLLDLFTNIEKCNITPIIILDGGFEYKKLKTLYMRMNNRINTIKNLNPSNQGYYELNPLLLMEVFKETLHERNVKIIVCDFEADFQIASVARYINCPVLSLDSDYFIYDCLYIPINTLDLLVYNDQGKFYLRCKLYRVDKFLNYFGGLDKALLPLVATLLGNDYVQKSTFEVFFSQLKLPHTRSRTNDQQRTIAALLNWLRPQTFEAAKERVLGRIKQHLRPQIDKVICESVDGYNCSSEYILEHFSLKGTNQSEDSSVYKLIDTSDNRKREYMVPNWFIEKYRCGIYPSSFINLITKQTYLCTPQMEDVNLLTSHNISLRIIQIIFGLLTSLNQYKYFSYITRADHKSAQKYKMETIYRIENICDFPPLDQLPNLPKEFRDGIFFHALNMKLEDLEILNCFPEDWRLFVIAITYWIRTITDLKVLKEYLLAFILCIVHLKCLDTVIGYHRSQKVFLSKYKNQIDLLAAKSSETTVNDENTNLIDLINNITQTDAMLAVNLLISNFNINEKLFTNPKNYSIRIVHCFAEFQSAFRQIQYLNSLLEYPFLPTSAALFYNGTFIYNMVTNLKKRKDAFVYLSTLLESTNTVFTVVKKIISLFQSLVPSVFEDIGHRK